MKPLPAFGLLCLLAAVGALAFYVFQLRTERAYQSWPTVPGKVQESSLVRTTRDFQHTSSTGTSTRGETVIETKPVWALQLLVNYEVSGQDYACRQATSTDEVDLLSANPHSPARACSRGRRNCP